jgi:hypothetical protein
MAPKITGTCRMVALPAKLGIGIIPSPVTLSIMVMAPNTPEMAMVLVDNFLLCLLFCFIVTPHLFEPNEAKKE